MPRKCCGNCARFAYEDLDGFGWCLALDRERSCGHTCEFHETKTEPITQPE